MHLNIPIRHDKEIVDGVEKEVKVISFNATLFALVRTALDVDCKGTDFCFVHVFPSVLSTPCNQYFPLLFVYPPFCCFCLLCYVCLFQGALIARESAIMT